MHLQTGALYVSSCILRLPNIFFRDKAYSSDYISPYKRSANNIHKVLVKKMTFIYPVLYFDATTHLNYATLTWK